MQIAYHAFYNEPQLGLQDGEISLLKYAKQYFHDIKSAVKNRYLSGAIMKCIENNFSLIRNKVIGIGLALDIVRLDSDYSKEVDKIK